MMLQLPEQPTASLPALNQENVSKLSAKEGELSSEATKASSTSPSFHSRAIADDQRGWANGVSRLLNSTDALGQYVRRFIAFLAATLRAFFRPDLYLVYEEAPLSLETRQQLEIVGRKTLILDLDETLVHSCYLDPDTNEIVGCNCVPESAVPDYVLNIQILADLQPVEFQVFKRPFVDEFLDYVGRWYDVVIYTASLESYASIVVDKLDAGRGILDRRFFRQHCITNPNFMSKNLYVVNRDLSSVLIVDNTPSAYRDFPENALPIKSYIYDPEDKELLNMLPFLDALRFAKDVRSILGRREIVDQSS